MLIRTKTAVGDSVAKSLIDMNAAEEVVEPNVPAQVDDGAWPRVVQITTPQGTRVNVKLLAPVNPAWYPSELSARLAADYTGELGDPSNGWRFTPPLPLRSEAGFPLDYANAGGWTSYVGTPSVKCGDVAMNSDAEMIDYIARSARPQSGGVRTGAPTPHDDAHGGLDPSVIAEWQALPGDDRARGTWLNRKGSNVARLLLNNGYMSHADSARYDLAAGGYTQ